MLLSGTERSWQSIKHHLRSCQLLSRAVPARCARSTAQQQHPDPSMAAAPRPARLLMALDFDHTICDGNTDTWIVKALEPSGLPQDIQESYVRGQWTEYMQASAAGCSMLPSSCSFPRLGGPATHSGAAEARSPQWLLAGSAKPSQLKTHRSSVPAFLYSSLCLLVLCCCHLLQRVLQHLHSAGVAPSDLQQLLQQLPYTAGFDQLWQHLQGGQAANGHTVQTIILSDSNSLFIDWILSSRGHAHLIRQALLLPQQLLTLSSTHMLCQQHKEVCVCGSLCNPQGRLHQPSQAVRGRHAAAHPTSQVIVHVQRRVFLSLFVVSAAQCRSGVLRCSAGCLPQTH